jgi:predicted DNA-binding transcriptional regulator AlpA
MIAVPTTSRPRDVQLPPRLWTHQETAEFLGLSPATLHDLNYKRTGPRSFKVGRHRRYDPRDVIAWLAERASDIDSPQPTWPVHNLSSSRSSARGRL